MGRLIYNHDASCISLILLRSRLCYSRVTLLLRTSFAVLARTHHLRGLLVTMSMKYSG